MFLSEFDGFIVAMAVAIGVAAPANPPTIVYKFFIKYFVNFCL